MLILMYKRLFSCLFIGFAFGVQAPAVAQLQDIFSDELILDNLGSAVSCDLSARLKADMGVDSLYEFDGVQCNAVIPRDSGEYFSDPACTMAVVFRPTRQQQFCADALDKENLGQGDDNPANDAWTLSPGTTYDIGAASLDGLQQPYRTSITYQTIDTTRGQCRLEMRIYKNDLRTPPNQQRSMIALHGGSWSRRGFGAFGIEATVARYTAQGFVVFAPFYRLLSDYEGGACNGVSLAEITGDVETALDWVENNAARYGASGTPLVFGQSAGAHLALSLAVNHPQRIAASVLMYPPTDFTDFLSQVQSGDYTNSEGLGILEQVLGRSADQFDLNESPVPENSFPAIVSAQPTGYPPMLIMHGLADELVPARQSIRLCNALAGRELSQNLEPGQLYASFSCGDRSELHLFKEARHALDVCLSSDGLLSATCLSGSEQSRQLVAVQMESAANWAATAVAVSQSGTPESGGGMMPPLSLFLVFVIRVFGGRCSTLVSVRGHSHICRGEGFLFKGCVKRFVTV